MSIYECVQMSFPTIPQKLWYCFFFLFIEQSLGGLILVLDSFHCEYVNMFHTDWDSYLASQTQKALDMKVRVSGWKVTTNYVILLYTWCI